MRSLEQATLGKFAMIDSWVSVISRSYTTKLKKGSTSVMFDACIGMNINMAISREECEVYLDSAKPEVLKQRSSPSSLG